MSDVTPSERLARCREKLDTLGRIDGPDDQRWLVEELERCHQEMHKARAVVLRLVADRRVRQQIDRAFDGEEAAGASAREVAE